jgi:hypothetical protein
MRPVFWSISRKFRTTELLAWLCLIGCGRHIMCLMLGTVLRAKP